MVTSIYRYKCTCGEMATYKQHTGRSVSSGFFLQNLPALLMFLKGFGIVPTAGPKQCLCCEKKICKKCRKGDLCETCSKQLSKPLLVTYSIAKVLSFFLFISVMGGIIALFSGISSFTFNFIYILLGGLGGFIIFWILWNITTKIILKKGKVKKIAKLNEEKAEQTDLSS